MYQVQQWLRTKSTVKFGKCCFPLICLICTICSKAIAYEIRALKLVWPELREILELSGVKKGPIYEIKSYISQRKAKMPTEQRSSSIEEKLLGASKSSQN